MPADRGWALMCFGFGGQDPMQNRRKFVLILTAGFVAMSFVVASVLADEILGFITKVDFDAKKVTVVEKDKDDETVLTTDDKTEYFAKKGEEGVKVDKEVYEKIEKAIDKAKEKGKKGAFAKITYDKKVISKIERIGGKGKKAATTN
jgi:hypothetical protein